MKRLLFSFLIAALVIFNSSCNAQSKNKDNSQSEEVTVYYFHFSHRCATCLAVEEVSKEAVESLYEGEIEFLAYNLDEPEGKSAGDQLGISGQTLLVAKGAEKIDLTSEGFLNARNEPEKLKALIKEKVDSLK